MDEAFETWFKEVYVRDGFVSSKAELHAAWRAAAICNLHSDAKPVGTVLGGEFHYLSARHGLPDGTMLYLSSALPTALKQTQPVSVADEFPRKRLDRQTIDSAARFAIESDVLPPDQWEDAGLYDFAHAISGGRFDSQTDDLASLVRRLARAMKNTDENNVLASQAMDYLERHGLTGNPMRSPLNGPSGDSEQSDWQPIETAPKDGTRLLLSTPTGKLADGMWGTRYGAWIWPYVLTNPTHWMPAPPIPVST